MVSNAHRDWLCQALFAGFGIWACDPTRHDAPSTSRPESTIHSENVSSTFEATSSATLLTAAGGSSHEPSTTSEQVTTTPATATNVTNDRKLTTTQTKATTSPHRTPDVHTPKQQTPSPTVVQGPTHSGEGFRVYLQTTSPIALGQTKPFTVVIEPQAPYKSNDKYPYRFAGLSAQGVALSADSITGADITPNRTTLQVNATGTSPGEGTLSGTLSFSVCTAEKCLVERASLSIRFSVTANN